MLAQHAAAGLLQSGATLKKSVKIWASRSEEAVTGVLAEIGSVIEKRDKEWSQAIGSVKLAIEAHRLKAEDQLGRYFRMAAPPGDMDGGAMRAVRGLLDAAAQGLLGQVDSFGDGWTAPRPKKWNERHPVAFAVIMAIMGAALALAGRAAF